MNSSLFMLQNNHDTLWELVYIDDIIVTGSNPHLIDQFIARLSKQLFLKDLKPL